MTSRVPFNTTDEENRIVLFVAAFDGRHQTTRGDWKILRIHLARTARPAGHRRVTGGTTLQVRDVINCSPVSQLPSLYTLLVGGVHGEDRSCSPSARDKVLPRWQWKCRLLHDQTIFVQPPISRIKHPIRRSDAPRREQLFEVFQPYTAWAGINFPYPPFLRAFATACTWLRERRDELRWNPLKFHSVREGRATEEQNGHDACSKE